MNKKIVLNDVLKQFSTVAKISQYGELKQSCGVRIFMFYCEF